MNIMDMIVKALPPGMVQQMLSGVENMEKNFLAILSRLTALEAQNAEILANQREILSCLSTKDQRAA
jgi:hypothetical protein